jgi:hypothetical protein
MQAAGYLKYTFAKDAKKGVFFRGQTKLYPNMAPALLRGVKNGQSRLSLLDQFLSRVDAEKKALRAVDPLFREALLQHYGIRTTWLDVVDNVWIALWFGCHDALVTGWPEEYLHFERRTVDRDETPKPKYVYLLLMASASFDLAKGQPGHYRDDQSETIDLRVATPSHFVRPHAQHGLLIRRLSKAGRPASDYQPLNVGTIRVSLQNALDWMGDASTLSTHSIFPPAYYDAGYFELLRSVVSRDPVLGSIYRLQP